MADGQQKDKVMDINTAHNATGLSLFFAQNLFTPN